MSETPQPLGKEAVQAAFDRSPFIATLGLVVESLDHEAAELTVRMTMAPTLERRPGTRQFHGGPLAALIDVVGDFAIGMLVGGGVPTVNLRIDYVKPAIGEAVTATARVRRRGRAVTVVDVDVLDSNGALVALGRGTYSSTPA